MIRLVALDIDDTLTADGLTISPRVIQAVQNARRMGVQIVLTTGRMFQSARQFAEMMGLEGPIICYHGASIRVLPSGEALYEKVITPELGHQLVALLRAEAIEMLMNFDDDLYCERITPALQQYANIAKVPLIQTTNFWLQRGKETGPIKIVLVVNPGKVKQLLSELRVEFGKELGIFQTSSHLIEFIAAGVDKASALNKLAYQLGISSRDVMAIGDGSSDAAMISWAGLGVAMGNASSELKLLADLVTGCVEEDGVAQVLEKYLGEDL